jgi:hypothetical protein
MKQIIFWCVFDNVVGEFFGIFSTRKLAIAAVEKLTKQYDNTYFEIKRKRLDVVYDSSGDELKG